MPSLKPWNIDKVVLNHTSTNNPSPPEGDRSEGKFEKKEAVQQTKLNSSQEIKDLKLSVSQLRKELENLKFEKQQEVQQTKLSSTDEINQLKSSAQTLRDELEKVIFNYEQQIKKYKKWNSKKKVKTLTFIKQS